MSVTLDQIVLIEVREERGGIGDVEKQDGRGRIGAWIELDREKMNELVQLCNE